MATLEINGNVVELGNNKLVFSKVGYSFEDWLTKDIQYSERVTLPETSLLNTIFKRPYSPDISTGKFSKFYTYKYKENGKIASSGIARLSAFNSNREYELQLLDSVFGLTQNLKKDLNALDFESSDFIFNSTSYNSLKVLNSSVWIWAASSMHQNKTLSKNILSGNLAFSRPFFSVKRLIDKMFLINGWTYDLEINTDIFDKFIISAKNEFVFTSYEKSFTGTFSTGNLDLSVPDFIQGDTVSPATQLNLTYKSRLRFRGNAVADNDFVLTITVAGIDPQVQTFAINKGSADYDLTSNDIEAGNAVTINITGTGNVEFSNFLIYTIIDENDFGTMSSANFTDFKVKTYDNLPEISQIELFKNCLVKVGGFFTTDNFKKTLTVNSVVSLSKIGAIDWSEKFIEDSEEIEPLKGYGQLNYFSYNNSDIKPSNLGRGQFQINNETLPDLSTIFESIFAASSEVTITDKMIDNTVYNDTERINSINDLIAYYEEVGSYSVARFEEINGSKILSTYYQNFITAIQKGEVFQANFKLNKSDFFLFDFKNLVYLQQKKSIFYVLGVKNYTEGESTEVILLKT